MNDQQRIETAADNCEVLRARLAKYEDAEGNPASTIAEQAREIERLRLNIAEYNEHERCYQSELAALKAQPSGVVPELRQVVTDALMGMISAVTSSTPPANEPPPPFIQAAIDRAVDRIARLNSSPVSAGATVKQSLTAGGVDERVPELSSFVAFADALGLDLRQSDDQWNSALTIYEKLIAAYPQARAALSAPSHGEQVREGWQLVPVEPTDAMLEAGDKYIGTPATYKAMLSACPSPAITKDFSQFLSAVMDAAGLIRHGRQSKELSEYLGMKCMEYRGAAPSAGSHQGGDV